jgi:hypothetical protein
VILRKPSASHCVKKLPFDTYKPISDFAPWPGPVVGYQEQVTTQVQRQLHVTISQAAGGQKVYDVLVENASRTADPMKVLPAMAVSAFEGFPGQNGVLRRVDVKTDE